jgi:hypothetical protein
MIGWARGWVTTSYSMIFLLGIPPITCGQRLSGVAYQILIFTAGRQLGAPTTAIYPEPGPNDGHPSASDLATNATDGVRRVAAAASRAVAAALGEGVAHGRQREEL